MSLAQVRFTGRCKILLFGVNAPAKKDLGPFLHRHFPSSTVVDLAAGPTAQEMTRAFEGTEPKLCFVQVSGPGDPALELFPLLLQYDAKLPVIALPPQGQPDLILKCLRLGATDFLIPPFDGEQAAHAFDKAVKLFPPGSPANPPAKIYSVIPAKGACGATTLACSLVYEWKRFGMNRLLLADLDPLTGVIAFLFKLKSQASFTDVLQRTADMDADLWKAMVTVRDGVDVLLAPENPADFPGENRDPSPILEYARYNYDVVVADAGCAFGEWSLLQARASDEVLLVTTNEHAAVQAGKRVLSYLEQNGVGRWKIRLIVNRYNPQAGISRDAVAEALGLDVYHVLPSDYSTVHKALLDGRSIPPGSGIGKSVAALADRLSGRERTARKSSPFGGLLALFSRTSS